MKKVIRNVLVFPWLIVLIVNGTLLSQSVNYPNPENNSKSPLMLAGDWVPNNSQAIDFSALPKVPSEHAIVSDVRYGWGTKVNQHNYLVHHGGKFWAMWSDGPGVPREGLTAKQHREVVPGHDRAGQLISYSTSKDGLNWTEPRDLAGPPDDGFGWIARGFWVNEGKLLALITRYSAPGYTGEGLQLRAFELVTGKAKEWKYKGLVSDNAMNNFPPKRVPTGQWMMSRRDKDSDVFMMVGGIKGFDQWDSFPVIGYKDKELSAEEPYWWVLPDKKNIVALFRDNLKSGFLFRAFSKDNGQSWTRPVKTNFPDARSKFSGLRMSDGRYVLVSNSNPQKRDPLTIAVSDDGLVFTKLGYLVGGRHIDYPHIMEHRRHLYVAFAGAKQTVEVLKIRISDLDKLDMSAYKK